MSAADRAAHRFRKSADAPFSWDVVSRDDGRILGHVAERPIDSRIWRCWFPGDEFSLGEAFTTRRDAADELVRWNRNGGST